MSTLEQEILEKLMALDEPARRRIVQAAASTLPDESAQSRNWLETKRTIRARMRAKYGVLQSSIADLLNEVREERLNDLTDRY